MKLSSPAFTHNGTIPSKYTCDGKNISPPLVIDDVPKNAKSLVLIMDDPDVPAPIRPERIWVHWILFNIPATIREIPENCSAVSISARAGKGDYPHLNYGGPCPPPQFKPSEHRYFFKLYALNCVLDLSEGATKKEIENTMQKGNHVLDEAVLIGRYERKR